MPYLLKVSMSGEGKIPKICTLGLWMVPKDGLFFIRSWQYSSIVLSVLVNFVFIGLTFPKRCPLSILWQNVHEFVWKLNKKYYLSFIYCTIG